MTNLNNAHTETTVLNLICAYALLSIHRVHYGLFTLYELLTFRPTKGVSSLFLRNHLVLMKNSVDPDQLKPADLDLHNFHERI